VPADRLAVIVALRRATAVDAARVAGLLIDVRTAFTPYAPSVHSDDDVRAWVRSELIPSGRVTVAESSTDVIGMIATACDGGCSWITHMAVDPSWVGRGVGSKLLTERMRTLTRPIRLFTFQANLGARRFYERHGFRAVRFSDGESNEERCPDVLYELAGVPGDGASAAAAE
jgi:ribosomal protein S18 acetylase RimI-like enzyme